MPKNITIQKILGILLHRIHIILISGALVGLIFFIYTSVAITPVYSTSAMIYILNYGKNAKAGEDPDKQPATGAADSGSSANSSNNETAQKIFNSDMSGSAALAANCIILFQNSKEITSYYDGCAVSMSTTDNSFYVTINVSGSDPQKCANVANIVAEKCDEVFNKYFSYGKTGVIREAYAPTAPVSPDKMKNTLIGVAIGIVLACIVAILMELIDTTIKSDDDLSTLYKVPVFAEIPDFENTGR